MQTVPLRGGTPRRWVPTGILTLVLLAVLAAAAPAALAQRPTLYWGSRGQQVRVLQWRLQEWGYYRGPIDGIFGNSTSQAVPASKPATASGWTGSSARPPGRPWV